MPRIVVIGIGPSGLAAIKSCKEEGLDVVGLEKNENYGGMWKYREDPNIGSVAKTTISLFSKEMCAYSDFPPPQDFPNYPHHSQRMDYLRQYVEHFNLLPHMRFHHEVIQVSQTPNFEESGQWIVKWHDALKQNIFEDIFDGVFVCTGRRNYPMIPHFPDQEIFRGKIFHHKFLKNPQEYENQNVLIIGFGNSAVDAACDISGGAKQVYLSIRNGRWVIPKVGKQGLPADTQFFKRDLQILQRVQFKRYNTHLENLANARFNHDEYKINPIHNILDYIPTISDDLPDKILTARVIVKDEICRMTEDGVIFKNEGHVTKVDVIILATGYEAKFPFLEDRLWTTYKKNINLYKYIFPLGLANNSLAIIGQIQPLGPSAPIAESQCRWAAQIFKKKLNLPTQDAMSKDAQTKLSQLAKRFPGSPKQCPIVDYIDYMDELANQYGTKPNLMGLLMKDPTLFWACCFGPYLPYQYRLQGPHAWDKARDTILNSHERITFPLNRNPRKSKKKASNIKPVAQSNHVIN